MFKKFTLILAAFTALSSFAQQLPQNLSPQQIEQFKKLPPAQQRQLAQSMGIDLSVIKQLTKKDQSGSFDSLQSDLPQQFFPRDTKFDQFGNPILDEDSLKKEEEDSKELKPFGYDVFANAPYTFAPEMDIAIPSDYVIGSGDEITIQVFGKDSNEYTSKVSREGVISVGDIGAFKVAGLTFIELKSFISSNIKERLVGAEVVTTLSSLRSIRVFVVGEAFKPGPYVLNGLSSITHALFAAGGMSEIGSLRNIKLKRNGKLITNFDAYDLLIHGDSSQDHILKSGDVIMIEPVGQVVSIEGEVRRPAIYEIDGSESFKDVISMAGGFLPSAYRNSTNIERFNGQNVRTMVSLDLSSEQELSKTVQSGDHIQVLKTSESFEESVTLVGAVARPGKYQWFENQRISDILKDIHGSLLEDADLAYGLVVREKDQARNIEVLQFSMFDIAANQASEDNIILQPQDKILIFSVFETIHDIDKSYDSLAMTEQEIADTEKEKAKKKFEDKMFWLEYGTQEDIKELDEIDQNLQLASKTLEELTGGTYMEEIDVKDLTPFSRKRLLTPVIEKLRRQAAAGQPVKLVEIVGSVKNPGVYPLTVDSDVTDLIAASGGLLESAYLDKAELTRNRINGDGAAKDSINLSLKGQLSGEQRTVLASKDRLNILQIPSWQEDHVVELRGEFMFPGKYTIRRGETLSQLIERVGGYTNYAHLAGSVFTREKLKQMELQNLLKVADSLRMEIASKSLAQNTGASIDYEQARMLLADLTRVQPVGRLVVDLPNIQEKNDVLLENGDVVYVPTKQNSVNVMGQVQVATSHLFKDKFTVADYIRLSGGSKQRADEDRIYVIKANGSVEVPRTGNWFTSDSGQYLEPGDTIIVPLDSEYMNDISLWATGTQIVYQAAVAIAAISGI